jgi:hypothetical protein
MTRALSKVNSNPVRYTSIVASPKVRAFRGLVEVRAFYGLFEVRASVALYKGLVRRRERGWNSLVQGLSSKKGKGIKVGQGNLHCDDTSK